MWFSLTVPIIIYNSLGNKKTNKEIKNGRAIFSP